MNNQEDKKIVSCRATHIADVGLNTIYADSDPSDYGYPEIETPEDDFERFPYLRKVKITKLCTLADGKSLPIVTHEPEPEIEIEEEFYDPYKPLFGTVFSEDRKYRYVLERVLNGSGPVVVFIGLNPSIADETQNDPTIRRCIGFAKKWGVQHMVMVNLFALRTPYPKKLFSNPDPIGPENDRWIKEVVFKADQVIACWGINGAYMERDIEVTSMLNGKLCELHCLGLTKRYKRFPRHPLYLPLNTETQIFQEVKQTP